MPNSSARAVLPHLPGEAEFIALSLPWPPQPAMDPLTRFGFRAVAVFPSLPLATHILHEHTPPPGSKIFAGGHTCGTKKNS